MNANNGKTKNRFGLWIGLTCLVGAIGASAILWRSDSQVTGKDTRKFTLDVDFNKFRQILVRTDATGSIVEHGGMKLTDESVNSLDIDLVKDKRPILNALVGKSNADVASGKRLTVQLADPQLEAKELFLVQDAQILSDTIHVRTESARPAGKLHSYGTTLAAKKDGDQTRVSLTIGMSVDVHISPLLLRSAKSRVQDAASTALENQEMAIRDLVNRFADKSIILPTLGRSSLFERK